MYVYTWQSVISFLLRGGKKAELQRFVKYPLLPLPKAQQYFNELSGNLQHTDCFMKYTWI